MQTIGLRWVLAPAVLFALSAHADTQSQSQASFDRPLTVQDIKAKSADAPGSEIRCTWYADLMVRETGTDTPGPDNATLIPIGRGASKRACKPAPAAGAITLKTEGFGLTGRKGGFLIWDLSDPTGAEPFMVMSAATGRVLFTDATAPALGPRRSVSLAAGVLHLAYTRAYNAPCSLLQDAQACWAKLKAAGVVPSATPALPLVQTSCRIAYKGIAASDPSIIVFKTEVAINAAGKHQTLSRGPMGCLPMP